MREKAVNLRTKTEFSVPLMLLHRIAVIKYDTLYAHASNNQCHIVSVHLSVCKH